MTSSASYQSLLKLIATLLIIPALFSLWPHRHIIPRSKCYVGPVRGDIDGIGTTSPIATSARNERSRRSTIPNELYGIWMIDREGSTYATQQWMKCNLRHPSTHSIPEKASLSNNEPEWDCQSRYYYTVHFNQQNKSWCFIDRTKSNAANQSSEFCSSNKNQSSSSSEILSGVYTSTSNPEEQISVRCSSQQQQQQQQSSFHFSQRSKNEFYPTTSLLLLINIGLAFIYWDKRVDPYTVCKHYSKIITDMELWRSFTGALAHFEPLHLGFNMMSLQALGTALEPRYGSISFLHYNICMIPLTTIVVLILIKLRIKYTGNYQPYAETSSVGFSGVLFAWMVVTSLESHQVCPIPFASNMCFDTHEFHIVGNMRLKFNWGPFVQLVFAQFIMPRVSFVGHLAGIICGYVFHWRLFPTSILWSTQVLIPLIILLHWRLGRNMKLFMFYNSDMIDESGSIVGVDVEEIHSSTKANERKSRDKRLMLTLVVMIMISVVTATKFGLMKSMTLSQILCCIMLFMSIQRQRSRMSEGGGSGFPNIHILHEVLIWRGLIVTLIIALISDAMVVPIWFISQLGIHSYHGMMYLDFWNDPLIMTMRWITNFLALVQASNKVLDIGGQSEDEPKVFTTVFGKIVRWSSEVGKCVSHKKASSFTPFGGTGVVLGSSATSTTSSSNQRTRMSVDL